MDRGIWATWYDLPDEGSEEYLDWLHGEYLPALQAKPGINWVAHYGNDGGGADMQKVRDNFPKSEGMEGVGTGTQFLMLAGACLLYTSPSPRDQRGSRMPSSA